MPPTGESGSDEEAFRVVVLASGSGSNLQAILDRLHHRDGIRVLGVGSDRPDAFALERATAAGIPTATFPLDEYPDRDRRDSAMADWIDSVEADLVVLAGFMALLTPGFIARYRNRIVNVHPSLLPAFPGLDAIGQALAAGAGVTGVTVHFVDEGTDTGPVITQEEVAIPPESDRETLEAAIHAVEHRIFPEAIRMVAQGRVRIAPTGPDGEERVIIEGEG